MRSTTCDDEAAGALGFNDTAGWANSTLTLLVTRGCAAFQKSGLAIRADDADVVAPLRRAVLLAGL